MSKTDATLSKMQSRLAYRLRALSPEQRAELCRRMEISESTFWRALRDPGNQLTLVEADKLRQYLEELDDCDYDMYYLLQTVDLRA